MLPRVEVPSATRLSKIVSSSPPVSTPADCCDVAAVEGAAATLGAAGGCTGWGARWGTWWGGEVGSCGPAEQKRADLN